MFYHCSKFDNKCLNFRIRDLLLKKYLYKNKIKEHLMISLSANLLSRNSIKEVYDKYYVYQFPWSEKEKQKEIENMFNIYNNIVSNKDNFKN